MTRAAVLLALGLAACGNDHGIDPGDSPDAMPSTLDAPPVVDGAAAYVERCSRCHGPAGTGDAANGPQIQSPVHGYATYVTRHGRGQEMDVGSGMDAYDSDILDDATLKAILEYLSTAPKPADGVGLYVRYCANCHGADARGGRVEESLVGDGDDGDDGDRDDDEDELLEKVREGHGGTGYGNRTKYMPKWSALELTNADVAKIATYLQGL